MKQLNNYISEKLYIGKGYNTLSHKIEKNKRIFLIDIIHKSYNVSCTTWLKCIDIDKNQIKYISLYKKDPVEMTDTIKINSNGYYESYDEYSTGIWMSAKDGIKFCKKCMNELRDSHKVIEELKTMFDENDTELFEHDIKMDIRSSYLTELISELEVE